MSFDSRGISQYIYINIDGSAPTDETDGSRLIAHISHFPEYEGLLLETLGQHHRSCISSGNGSCATLVEIINNPQTPHSTAGAM